MKFKIILYYTITPDVSNFGRVRFSKNKMAAILVKL